MITLLKSLTLLIHNLPNQNKQTLMQELTFANKQCIYETAT